MQTKWLLLLGILLLCYSSAAQEKKLQLGLQSGINLSSLLSENTSQQLRGSQFLGLSFGLVARRKMAMTKHRFGPFKATINHYLETGINAVRQGFEFEFEAQNFYTEFYHLQIPLIWVFRANNSFFNRRLRKKNINLWTKTGFILSFHSIANQQKELQVENRAHPVFQNIQAIGNAQTFVYSAFGFQKTYKNGAVSSLGLSFYSAWALLFTSQIYEKNQAPIKNAMYNRNGSYISVDCQYFFGKRTKSSRQNTKTIYNPRFL